MDGYYNLNELVQSLIEEFNLYDDDNARNNLYQYLYQYFKKTGAEKLAPRAVNPTTKRECSYYSQAQRDALLDDETVVKHLCDIAEDSDYVNERLVKRVEAVEAYNEAYCDYMYEMAHSSPNDVKLEQDIWADNEVRRIKPQMMLEALFEVFFTPINEEELKKDLLMRREMPEPNPPYAHLEACERLKHPEGNYFSRRDCSPDNE